jgi:hypothetical protein
MYQLSKRYNAPFLTKLMNKRMALQSPTGLDTFVEVQLQHFLAFGLWSASRSDNFNLEDGRPGIHWTGVSLGHTDGLAVVWKRRISPRRRRQLNPDYPVVQPIA